MDFLAIKFYVMAYLVCYLEIFGGL